MSEYYSPYAPEQCSEDGHVPGCAGAAGGEHEFIVKPLDATRCVECGHRLDEMGGCDSCTADREAAEFETHDERHPDTLEDCSECDSRAERVSDYWQRAMRSY